MTAITLEVPDEIAEDVRVRHLDPTSVFLRGLSEIPNGSQQPSSGPAEIYRFFASSPTPEQVLALRPSRAFDRRLGQLLEKSKGSGLSPAEQAEWEEYEMVEHVVRLAKIRASSQLTSR